MRRRVWVKLPRRAFFVSKKKTRESRPRDAPKTCSLEKTAPRRVAH
mgnify:FL=1